MQSLEIEIGDGFVGMPFVLFSGSKWIKNNGSDFYVEFVGPKKATKVPLYLIYRISIVCMHVYFSILIIQFFPFLLPFSNVGCR